MSQRAVAISLMRGYACLLIVLLGLPVCSRADEPLTDSLGDPLPPRAVARLGTVRLRPGGLVKHLLFSPDGKRLAASAGLRTKWDGISIWDTATGRRLEFFPTDYPWVHAWSWTGESRAMAVIGFNERLEFCEFHDGTAERQDLTKTYDWPYVSFALSGVAKLLAITKTDADKNGYTLELRELQAQQRVADLKLLRVGRTKGDDPNVLQFTPNGRTLVAIARGEGISWNAVVWDVATGTKRRRLALPERTLRLGQTVAVSNKWLAVGLPNGSVQLHDLTNGEMHLLPNRHKASKSELETAGVWALEITPDEKTLVTAGLDGTVRQWNIATGSKLHEFPWSGQPPTAMAISPDGRMLAVGGYDGVIRLLDRTTGTNLVPQVGHQSEVRSVTASRDSRIAITTGLDDTIRIWDARAGREMRQIHTDGVVENCALTPNAETMAGGVHADDSFEGGPLHVWRASDGQEVPYPELASESARSVSVSRDGRTLVTVNGGNISIRAWPSGALQQEIELPRSRAKESQTLGRILALSADGKRLVTGARHSWFRGSIEFDAAEGPIELWDTTTGERVRELVGSEDPAAITSGGEVLLTGLLERDDHGIRVVDPDSGKVQRKFAPSQIASIEGQQFTALELSPDGRTAFLGGADGTIEVYNAATGELRLRLEGHTDRVTGLAVTADGHRLLSSSRDSTVLVWDVALPHFSLWVIFAVGFVALVAGLVGLALYWKRRSTPRTGT
jgi:WD40 repeat protein